MATNTIKELLTQGQSVWLDNITREMVQDGRLEYLIEEIGIRGETSNPTIFEKAIAGGTAYDEQITRLIERGKSAPQIFEAVAIEDIQAACDLFRPLYDRSEGGDGFVSIEVSPKLARNTEASLNEARRLWREVSRPNLMVKIPGTAEGVPALRQALQEGININITLLFSIQHYERVARAYIEALTARHQAKQPIDRVASVASFFVSRVDTLVDKLLEQKVQQATNDPGRRELLESLMGKAAVANAKLAYQRFLEIFGEPQFATLRAAGAKVQRPLWASTSTKNPVYSDIMYVEDLIGPDTINTMPDKTIDAFLDHGSVARTVDADVEGAREVMSELATVGIDIDAVTRQLEEEGIAAFDKSFDELLAGVEAKRQALATHAAAK